MNDCRNWSKVRGCCVLFDGAGCSHGKLCIGYEPPESVVIQCPDTQTPGLLTPAASSGPGTVPFVKLGEFKGKPTVTVGVKGEF